MGIEVLTGFIYSLIVYNIPLLYGTVGEIFNEKSGSLTSASRARWRSARCSVI